MLNIYRNISVMTREYKRLNVCWLMIDFRCEVIMKVLPFSKKCISTMDSLMVVFLIAILMAFIILALIAVISSFATIIASLTGLKGFGIYEIINTILLTVIIIELYVTVRELVKGYINVVLVLIIGLTAIIRDFIFIITKEVSDNEVFSLIVIAIIMAVLIAGIYLLKNYEEIHIWNSDESN